MTEPILTPREYAAIHIAAALIANPNLGNVTELSNTRKCEKLAVKIADTLLSELKRTE